jgi:hypothetical protein
MFSRLMVACCVPVEQNCVLFTKYLGRGVLPDFRLVAAFAAFNLKLAASFGLSTPHPQDVELLVVASSRQTWIFLLLYLDHHFILARTHSQYVVMATETRSLLDLPLEILLNIVAYTQPRTLAALRGSCHNLKVLVDPRLWHTIYIYPDVYHFEQMRLLSTSQSINQHVRQVVYDLRWLGIYHLLRKRIESVWSVRNPPEQKTRALELIGGLERDIVQASVDEDVELMLLRDIVRSFPALEAFEVVDVVGPPRTPDTDPDLHMLPQFYQNVTYKARTEVYDCDLEPDICIRYATSQMRGKRKRKILAIALTGTTLQHLGIRMSTWSNFMGYVFHTKQLELMGPQIYHLKSLTLHASFSERTQTHYLLAALKMFLEEAKSLENLDLAFNVREHDVIHGTFETAIEEEVGYDFDQYRFSLLKQLVEPRPGEKFRFGKGLKRLALSGVRCRHSEFAILLENAAPTLRALELSHVHLIREMTSSGLSPQAPDIVKLFRDISEALRLESIWLHGVFRASFRQRYILRPEWMNRFTHTHDPKGSLLTQTMDWILRQGPCPFENLAIKPGKDDLTSVQVDRIRKLCDNTIWTYSVKRNPHVDEEHTVSTSDTTSDAMYSTNYSSNDDSSADEESSQEEAD